MGIGKQSLDADGQPITFIDKRCSHGVRQDSRGNSACEECFENRLTDSYLLGVAVGWEQQAKSFQLQSGDAYADGDDARAALLRRLAKDSAAVGVLKREEQKRHAIEVGLPK